MFNAIKEDKTLPFVCLSAGTTCWELVLSGCLPWGSCTAGELQALTHTISSWLGGTGCGFQLVRCAPVTDEVWILFIFSFLFNLPPSPPLQSSFSLEVHKCSYCLWTSHTFRKQHNRGTFQLPRRRQIKQGCEGEIPPIPFLFKFVIACCAIARVWNDSCSV